MKFKLQTILCMCHGLLGAMLPSVRALPLPWKIRVVDDLSIVKKYSLSEK